MILVFPRRLVFFLAVLCVIATVSQKPVRAQNGDFLNIQRRITEIVEQYSDGVVRVKAAVEETDESGEPVVTQRVGTGFLISGEGHVLTNASVAFGVNRIWVELDGVPYAADHIGSDPETNVSLLKLMVLPETFTHFPISADPEPPAPGFFALAITSPLEFGPSPELGMVAGRESEFSGRVFPVTYTRVNIPAHPGEGGSPVLDLNGRLIGMIVASLPEVQSSYLLPARAIVHIRDGLLFSGEIRYGWFGIDVEERVNREQGRHVVVTAVSAKTPAAEGGIRAGDRLLKMGAFPIQTLGDFRDAKFFQRIGEYVDIAVERGDERLEIPLQMVERPSASETVSDISEAPADLLLAN